MKTLTLLSLFFILATCLTSSAAASSVFLDRKNQSPIDHVDVITGGLSLKSRPLLSVETANFGSIAVDLQFLSKAALSNPLLGPGWIVPIMDASAIPVDQDYLQVLYPNGTFSFFKKSADSTYAELGGTAKARLAQNTLTIEAKDGSILTYKNGRPWQLLSPNGASLQWEFQNHKFVRLVEIGGTDMSVSSLNDTLVFQTRERSATISLGKRLSDDPSGARQEVSSVRRILDADQNEVVVEYSQASGLTELMLVDPDRIFPPHREDIAHFRWNPATGHIAQVDSARYDISDADPYTGMFPKISRTSATGTDTFHLLHQGRIVEMKHADGSRFIGENLMFAEAGPKLRKAEYRDAAGTKHAIFKGNYDETGRLLRATDMNGNQFDFLYDQSEPGEVVIAAEGTEIYRRTPSQGEHVRQTSTPLLPQTDFELAPGPGQLRQIAARQSGQEVRAEISATAIRLVSGSEERIFPLNDTPPPNQTDQDLIWGLNTYGDDALRKIFLEPVL